jgi:hypothetical protein
MHLNDETAMSTSAPVTTALRFSRPLARAPHPVGARCDIRQFRHTDFDGALSPLVLVDHFVMRRRSRLWPSRAQPSTNQWFEWGRS